MSSEDLPIYEFGPFRLDFAERLLRRGDEPVLLTGKAFDVLSLLVRNSGRLLKKEELMRKVWPDSYVGDNNLTVSMSALRKALGEHKRQNTYIETIPRVGYRFIAEVKEVSGGLGWRTADGGGSGGRPVQTTSLAVLPFTNDTREPELDYLSDGIAESITSYLSRLPRVKVMARHTVLRYWRQNSGASEIGRALGVRAVLVGRIVQLSTHLVISVELVDSADGSLILGEQYRRPLSELLALQEEVSREIFEKLQVELTREEKKRLAKRYTNNVEAYSLYLKGRYFWNKYSREGLEKSLRYFEEAIALDPKFALAFTGLADSHYRLSDSFVPPRKALPKSKQAALRALELDDELAEAHTSTGLIKLYHDRDWAGAERAYRRAIELNPTSPMTHLRCGTFFMLMGRFEEAARQIGLALELDPLWLHANATLGVNLFMMRKHEEALEQFQKAIELDPHYHATRTGLGWCYMRRGDYRRAVAEFRESYGLEKVFIAVGLRGCAYAMWGQKREAEETLRELEESSQRVYVTPFYSALIYAALGDNDRAFDWLEKLYADGGEWLVWLKVIPELDSLRGDPRFANLLRRVGFASRC